MRIRSESIWENLHTSYWFVPSVLSLGSTVLFALTLTLDKWLAANGVRLPTWLRTGNADSAQTLLSTLAACTITVASLVFSITIVVFSLTSNQYGPRLLRTFMRDRAQQVTIGVFISAFLYSILVLRAVWDVEEGGTNVPQVSVSVALLMGLISTGFLVYYIHHIVQSIQASHIIADVGREFTVILNRMGEDVGHEPEAGSSDTPELPEQHAVVHCRRSGWIQSIHYDTLLRLADKYDIIIEVLRRPGHHLLKGTALFKIYGTKHVSDELRDQIAHCSEIGSRRTPTQDIEYCLRQLEEMAVRSLSPGVNDPYTANDCVDRLAECLMQIASRPPLCRHHYSKGRLRLVINVASPASMVDTAYDQIRQYGHGTPSVVIHLLQVLGDALELCENEEFRNALYRQAEMIYSGIADIKENEDREEAKARFERARRAYLVEKAPAEKLTPAARNGSAVEH